MQKTFSNFVRQISKCHNFTSFYRLLRFEIYFTETWKFLTIRCTGFAKTKIRTRNRQREIELKPKTRTRTPQRTRAQNRQKMFLNPISEPTIKFTVRCFLQASPIGNKTSLPVSLNLQKSCGFIKIWKS